MSVIEDELKKIGDNLQKAVTNLSKACQKVYKIEEGYLQPEVIDLSTEGAEAVSEALVDSPEINEELSDTTKRKLINMRSSVNLCINVLERDQIPIKLEIADTLKKDFGELWSSIFDEED